MPSSELSIANFSPSPEVLFPPGSGLSVSGLLDRSVVIVFHDGANDEENKETANYPAVLLANVNEFFF